MSPSTTVRVSSFKVLVPRYWKRELAPCMYGLSKKNPCRWVVVMPRYPSPVAPPGTERVVRTLMVAYKGRDQCVPTCKVPRFHPASCADDQPGLDYFRWVWRPMGLETTQDLDLVATAHCLQQPAVAPARWQDAGVWVSCFFAAADRQPGKEGKQLTRFE